LAAVKLKPNFVDARDLLASLYISSGLAQRLAEAQERQRQKDSIRRSYTLLEDQPTR